MHIWDRTVGALNDVQAVDERLGYVADWDRLRLRLRPRLMLRLRLRLIPILLS